MTVEGDASEASTGGRPTPSSSLEVRAGLTPTEFSAAIDRPRYTAIAAGFGLLALAVALTETGRLSGLTSTLLYVSGVGLVIVGSSLSALLYLRGTKPADESLRLTPLQLSNALGNIQTTLERKIGELKVPELSLSAEERTSLLSDVARRTATNNTVIAVATREERAFVQAHGYFAATQQRLQQEVSSLARRNQLNLIVGSATTFMAVAILVWLAGVAPSYGALIDAPHIIVAFLPRLALALSIEVFSFFFLRLYRAGLAEIKFFQNELTNAEARFAALDAAFALAETAPLAGVIASLAATERNFVLKAGESTVELERDKLENQILRDALAAAGSTASTVAGTKKE